MRKCIVQFQKYESLEMMYAKLSWFLIGFLDHYQLLLNILNGAYEKHYLIV